MREFLLGGAAALLVVASPAGAAVTVYTSQSEFQAAAGGAGALATETFNGFTQDTSFRNTALQFGKFTLSAPGTNDTNRNKIDVPPYFLSQTGNDGTPLINGYVNAGTTVVFTFAGPVRAFGGLFSQISNDVSGGVTANTAVEFDVGGTTTAVPLTTAAAFRGFVSDTAFTTVTLRRGSNNINDGFLIDNIQFSDVPEPGTWALMLVGFGACGAAMRARRTRATVRLAA